MRIWVGVFSLSKEKSLALDGRSGLDLDNTFGLAVHTETVQQVGFIY